jgi:hypothetical protein
MTVKNGHNQSRPWTGELETPEEEEAYKEMLLEQEYMFEWESDLQST